MEASLDEAAPIRQGVVVARKGARLRSFPALDSDIVGGLTYGLRVLCGEAVDAAGPGGTTVTRRRVLAPRLGWVSEKVLKFSRAERAVGAPAPAPAPWGAGADFPSFRCC